MTIMDKLITQIKEEWSDLASPKMKKFIIIVALALAISIIGVLLHSSIVIFIGVAILLWELNWIRHGYKFESTMEDISSIIIVLAASALIMGILNI